MCQADIATVVRLDFLSKSLQHTNKICIFAARRENKNDMITKQEAMQRFMQAKKKKLEAVASLEQRMKQAYEETTGKKANYVVTL